MTEFLSGYDFNQKIALLTVAGGFLCALVAIIGGLVASCVRHAREISFKEDMIARGMSAEEVRAVIESRHRR